MGSTGSRTDTAEGRREGHTRDGRVGRPGSEGTVGSSSSRTATTSPEAGRNEF